MASKSSGNRLSPAATLGVKCAMEFLKIKNEPKPKVDPVENNKIKGAKSEGNQKPQMKLKSLTTGELMSSTTVKIISETIESGKDSEQESIECQNMTCINVEPVTSRSVAEVEGEVPPSNDDESGFEVISNKRRLSHT